MERAVFVADLARLPSADERRDRLYLGSEFCVRRLPGERGLHEALTAAARRGIAFTLVTPFLDEPGLGRALDLVRALPRDASTEVVANDLGLMEALRAAGWGGTLVAGRLLTRQRRGPGFQSFGGVPAEAAVALRASALDSAAFVDLLVTSYDVRRFELDDLVQGITVPPLPDGVRLSLYRPWLLVTASRNCPWVFDGRTWAREACARPCRGRLLRLRPGSDSQSSLERDGGGGVARSGNYQAARTSAEVPGGMGPAEGWREAGDPQRADRREHGGGAQRQDPGACMGPGRSQARDLILGGCAQFLEHRSDAPPPAAVDRIVWQPEVPA